MPVIRIYLKTLSLGSLPVYDFGPWPYPVYCVGEDGESVLVFENKRRFMFPEFELSGINQNEVYSKLMERIINLCLTAGFAGKAGLIIRSDMACSGVDVPVMHILNCSLFFTIDWDPVLDGFGYNGMSCGRIPPNIDDIDGAGPELKAHAAIMEVFYT